MAIRDADKILELVRSRIGEDTSDESITFIEDITDTINDYEARTKEDREWETRYNENDAAWRKRYMERFNASSDASVKDGKEAVKEQEENVTDDGKKRSYKELFEEREG